MKLFLDLWLQRDIKKLYPTAGKEFVASLAELMEIYITTNGEADSQLFLAYCEDFNFLSNLQKIEMFDLVQKYL